MAIRSKKHLQNQESPQVRHLDIFSCYSTLPSKIKFSHRRYILPSRQLQSQAIAPVQPLSSIIDSLFPLRIHTPTWPGADPDHCKGSPECQPSKSPNIETWCKFITNTPSIKTKPPQRFKRSGRPIRTLGNLVLIMIIAAADTHINTAPHQIHRWFSNDQTRRRLCHISISKILAISEDGEKDCLPTK